MAQGKEVTIELDIDTVHKLQAKAARLDKLEEKIAAHYEEGKDDNLCDIGYTAASFFGWL